MNILAEYPEPQNIVIMSHQFPCDWDSQCTVFFNDRCCDFTLHCNDKKYVIGSQGYIIIVPLEKFLQDISSDKLGTSEEPLAEELLENLREDNKSILIIHNFSGTIKTVEDNIYLPHETVIESPEDTRQYIESNKYKGTLKNNPMKHCTMKKAPIQA